jgi:glutaminyl-peptide cyclotransferase
VLSCSSTIPRIRRRGALVSAALLGSSLFLAAACSGADAAARAGERAAAASSAPAVDGAGAEFDGAAAMANVVKQLGFGARVPGSAAHRAAGDWLVAELQRRADSVVVQQWTHVTVDGQRLPMRNILARFRPGEPRRVLYVAHWDSRPSADMESDPAHAALPVPGGNDGASGVAILLGVAEALKRAPSAVGVDLLLVDGEDWGSFDTNTDVLIGSTWFADHLPEPGYAPVAGVLWDMVGDSIPVFEQEANSVQGAPEVVQRVWSTAQQLGYGDAFTNRQGIAITDDHLPLLRKGLRVIDVIDLDYPWHHRTGDTADKVSQRTLQLVGDVAMAVIRGF